MQEQRDMEQRSCVTSNACSLGGSVFNYCRVSAKEDWSETNENVPPLHSSSAAIIYYASKTSLANAIPKASAFGMDRGPE